MNGSSDVCEGNVTTRVVHFNRAQPQQGIEQKIPTGDTVIPEKEKRGKIIALQVQNGLRHDYRIAA